MSIKDEGAWAPLYICPNCNGIVEPFVAIDFDSHKMWYQCNTCRLVYQTNIDGEPIITKTEIITLEKYA